MDNKIFDSKLYNELIPFIAKCDDKEVLEKIKKSWSCVGECEERNYILKIIKNKL